MYARTWFGPSIANGQLGAPNASSSLPAALGVGVVCGSDCLALFLLFGLGVKSHFNEAPDGFGPTGQIWLLTAPIVDLGQKLGRGSHLKGAVVNQCHAILYGMY